METSIKYFFKDMSVMFGRSMRHVFRSLDTILTVSITPIAIMLLFVYVFGGAIETGAANYVDYLLPGILLMTIARSSVFWGHVLTSLISNGISVMVIILAAFVMGFRSSANALEWLAVFGILGIFTLALTWVAVIAGLAAKTPDGAGAFSYPIIFLPFISSAFVPTDTMPKVVRAFAENQPVTPIVDAIRQLLSGQSVNHDIFMALMWCLALTLVAYVGAMRAYKKI